MTFRRCQVGQALVVLALGAVALAAAHPPIVLDANRLAALRRGDDPVLAPLAAVELARARDLLTAGRVYAVTDNEGVPPSGDRRSYYSTGPYWWPDPDSPNGLPYVRRDGAFNPERDRVSDRPLLHAMVADVWTLAIAYAATGEERFAQGAARLLRVWFIDESTGMRPDLRHAQAIPGRTDGRGTGIIDALVFVDLVDALRLLEGSPRWPPEDQQAIRAWFAAYLDWLSFHPQGRDERAALNNHGTAYDLQQAAIAAYLDREWLVRHILDRVREVRLPNQVLPDGRQPLELARTRSWSYSTENLAHFARLAALARPYGIDLLATTTPAGASLPGALRFVAVHAAAPKVSWPYEQVTAWETEDLFFALAVAEGLFPDPLWKEAREQLPPPANALHAWLASPVEAPETPAR